VKIKSSLTILCKKFGLEHQLPKSTSIPQKKRKCIHKKLKYVNLFSQGIESSSSLVTMTTIITGHHDVVSSVASWLPISSTICLCQMGAVGCAV